MAEIIPFKALRYDPDQVKLEDVLTQPYDKITPEMQSKYYERSTHNLVRIILGKAGKQILTILTYIREQPSICTTGAPAAS